MEENLFIETSPALQKTFFDFCNLPIGGKKISCPYWMNKKNKLIYGPGGGKAKSEEIVSLVNQKAEEAGVDLNKLDEKQIVLFMKKMRIGIDCSGLAFWLLNSLDLEKGGNGIADEIPNSLGRFIKFRASVKMLTDDQVSEKIEELSDVRPGDMLRMKKGRHLLVILEVEKDLTGIPKKFIYGHSSSPFFTSVSGVHSQTIVITDSKMPLKHQVWLEQTPDNSNYADQLFLQNGDGIRRFKFK